jgi:hypothetical protein
MRCIKVTIQTYVRILHLSMVAVLLTACATQLAPSYDESIFSGLTASNKDVQTLFASVTDGASAKTFDSRASTYAHIIGELDALEVQAKSRPIPSAITLERANAVLSANGVQRLANDPKFTDFPSARSIQDAAETLKRMRLIDQREGLHGAEISAFENQASIYLAQAITYEAFLKR